MASRRNMAVAPSPWRRAAFLAPAQVIATGFAIAVLVGTLLLMLPASSASSRWTSFLDALFTSTSAVCVTGLVVADTPTHWSLFGQIVILLLIQVGGLGIMLFAALVGLALLRRLTVRSQTFTHAETKSSEGGDVRRLAIGILTTTLSIEAAVALALFIRFWTGYGFDPLKALWHGIFHAVSAFNNAGFTPHSDGIVPYETDLWILIPLMVGVFLGSLGATFQGSSSSMRLIL